MLHLTKHNWIATESKHASHATALLRAQGVMSASHVERDEQAGLTYDFTTDLSLTLGGIYNVFCVPDDATQEPYMLAKIRDTACYIHR